MAVTKIRKISSWTLLFVSIISLALFVLFYFGGVGEPLGVDQFKNPTYTGELLIWSYFLLGICAVSMLLFGITQFFNKLKTNPKGALSSLAVFAGFAILLIIAYMGGDGTAIPGINADSQKFNTPVWLKVTDMWLYAMYILLVLAIIAMAWGSVKKILSK
jgi:multisubunit Na+/H+ antiporter MnhB subunit